MDSAGGVWHTTSTPQEDTMSIVGKVQSFVRSFLGWTSVYVRICYHSCCAALTPKRAILQSKHHFYCSSVSILKRLKRGDESITTLKYLRSRNFRVVVIVRDRLVVAEAEFMANDLIDGSSILAWCESYFLEFPIHTPCLELRQSD